MQSKTGFIDPKHNFDILDSIPIATVCIDYDNTILFVNDKFIDLFGYTINEIPTLYDWLIKAFPDIEYRNININKWRNENKFYIEQDTNPNSYEVIIASKDGASIHTEVHTKLKEDYIIISFTNITEYKNHFEELIKNKLLLEKAQQITNIGYWEINLDTNKVWASDQAKNIYGYKPEGEISYEDIKNIPLLEYRPILDKKLINLINNNESYDVIFQLKRVDNGKILDIRSIAEYNAIEHKVFGVIQDISNIKKAEKEIIEKQERILAILNSSPIAIACFDNAFNLEFFNKKCTDLLGYSDSDVKTIYDWFILAYPDQTYREMLINKWNRSIQITISRDTAIDPMDAYVTCKDGTVRYIQFNTKLFSDLILISMVDMTENKKAMDLIAGNEIKFRAILENSTDAISVTRNNVHEFVNPAYLCMFGYENEKELINVDPINLIAKDCRILVTDYTEKRAKGEDVPTYYRTKGLKKNGVVFNISIKVSTYILNSELYTLVIIRDITDSINATNELIKAKDKAEESDRLKSAFLANMSHEIRTPMNAIMGFSELLCDPDLDADQMRQFTDIIHKRSDDLLVIINDILDVSRLEANQVKLIKNDGDLFLLFQDISSFFESKSLIDHDNLTFRKEYALSENESYINTDFGRLKQVLINLISNAFKFTKDGFIEIGCKLKDENNLLFYVKDTGIGIAKDKTTIIFERFRQADDSATRLYGGTGLGLAISKSLIDLFGGEIWVETEICRGSTFYFTIPYNPIARTKTKEVVSTKRIFDFTGKTVLIIEDDAFNSMFLHDVIATSKAKILTAENGKEAIEIFKQNTNIDIVLMDILLPDNNGYQLTQILLNLKNDQKIIAQTAFASEEDRMKCRNAGCIDFISKPINKNELMNLLDKYIHS